jgi:hypothetical protein
MKPIIITFILAALLEIISIVTGYLPVKNISKIARVVFLFFICRKIIIDLILDKKKKSGSILESNSLSSDISESVPKTPVIDEVLSNGSDEGKTL